jgi:hypothetical protein
MNATRDRVHFPYKFACCSKNYHTVADLTSFDCRGYVYNQHFTQTANLAIALELLLPRYTVKVFSWSQTHHKMFVFILPQIFLITYKLFWVYIFVNYKNIHWLPELILIIWYVFIFSYCFISMLFLYYDKFYILRVILTLYGSTEHK